MATFLVQKKKQITLFPTLCDLQKGAFFKKVWQGLPSLANRIGVPRMPVLCLREEAMTVSEE